MTGGRCSVPLRTSLRGPVDQLRRLDEELLYWALLTFPGRSGYSCTVTTTGPMAIALRRRSLIRIALFLGAIVLVRLFVGSSSSATSVSSLYGSDPQQIQKQGVLDLVTRAEKALDARKHKFLQVRMGRDERPDLFSNTINDGIMDYWERFQKPL